MEILGRAQLEFLAQTRGHDCVSIFLPTHRAGPETRQDPIRFRNLIKEAESKLVSGGLRPAKARQQLAPVRDLTQRSAFWRNQLDGLAVFFYDGQLQYFRLPVAFREAVIVADRFEISPLVPQFVAGRVFRVLALSLKNVRLFDGTPSGITERDIPGVPRSIDEALKFDVRESQLQVHSAARGPFPRATAPRGPSGKAAAVFTGQGVGVDDEQGRRLQFLLEVERGIRRVLHDQQAPLVLAAVVELHAEYRSINKYGRLLERGISGNPDLLKPAKLHAAAWEIVGPYFDAGRQKAIATFNDLADTDKRSSDLQEILMAAHQGRIESVFLPAGIQKWGKFDFEEGTLEVHAEPQSGDEDLFNVIAIQTILTRGEVYLLAPHEIPERQEVAAIFRFSTKPADFSKAQAAQA